MDYRFLVINNRHSALEYFFHYNCGLNSNKWAYFKSGRSNSFTVCIFGMCKLRELIYHSWELDVENFTPLLDDFIFL